MAFLLFVTFFFKWLTPTWLNHVKNETKVNCVYAWSYILLKHLTLKLQYYFTTLGLIKLKCHWCYLSQEWPLIYKLWFLNKFCSECLHSSPINFVFCIVMTVNYKVSPMLFNAVWLAVQHVVQVWVGQLCWAMTAPFNSACLCCKTRTIYYH